jgi:hypothetical protein
VSAAQHLGHFGTTEGTICSGFSFQGNPQLHAELTFCLVCLPKESEWDQQNDVCLVLLRTVYLCSAIGAVAPQGGCCAVGEVAVQGRCW